MLPEYSHARSKTIDYIIYIGSVIKILCNARVT